MTPQALIFDVFGTLVDWRSSIARAVAKALPDVDPFAFADAWRQEYQPAMQRIRDGARGYIPLDDLHRENLEIVAKRFDVTPSDPPSLARAWERLDPWPDTVSGLIRLKQHAIVAPCSNGSIALMTHLARHAGLPWDCILGADLAQDYKPQPAVYAACCTALRLPPEAVMMVAAHNSDLEAARECGLQTAYIPRPLEYGPKSDAETKPTQAWEHVANDMNALATQLGW